MTIQLTQDGMRAVFPKAPQAVIDAFVAKQAFLDARGITHTRTRLAFFFANIEHECAGFTIKNLTENTNYSPARAAQVWQNRFGSAAQVAAKYGNPIDRIKFFDDVYGGRMGNRPGTHDGSDHIGRGGPQVTGRDGYKAVAKHSGVAIDADPQLACRFELQPEICAGFWDWKALNRYADVGNFKAAVKVWNGGTNGLADREHLMAGNDPVLARLKTKDDVVAPAARQLPGSPPTPAPPKEVIDEVTKTERKTRQAAGAAGAAGAANETAKGRTGTLKPSQAPLPSPVAYGAIVVAVVAFVVVAVLIARKRSLVLQHWV